MADLATEIVLDLHGKVPPGSLINPMIEGGPYGARVHQATGMVSGQVNVNVKTALARLRARSFATSRPLSEVASDVVEGRLRLD